MVKEIRIRFGRIDLPDDRRPTPGELHENIDNELHTRIEKTVVEGEDPVELYEKGMNSCHTDNHGDHSFCQFTYIADKENSATVWEGDEVKDVPNNQPLKLRVFYFKNGQFAYEPRNELIDQWIPEFILSRTNIDTEIYNTSPEFTQKTMREFYWDNDKITLFKFESPDKEINSSSSLVQGLDELAEKISSQEFSGGSPPENLKELEVFAEAAKKMHILRLKGKNDDGYITEILSDGMKQIKLSESDWPAEAEQKQRAEAIYQKIAPYLRKVE